MAERRNEQMSMWMVLAVEIIAVAAALGAVMGAGAVTTAAVEWTDDRVGSARRLRRNRR